MGYTLLPASGSVRRDEDGAIIPDDAGNRDRIAYETWLAAGNVPSPAPASTHDPVLTVLAQAALAASDLTILRCVEIGIDVPVDWRAYRKALRAVLEGSRKEMPIVPAFPAGT